MPNYFFELSDDFAKLSYKYLAIYSGKTGSIWFSRLMLFADRVWIQDDSGIRFLKNRFTSAESKVDLEEFILIKLKAKAMHGHN